MLGRERERKDAMDAKQHEDRKAGEGEEGRREKERAREKDEDEHVHIPSVDGES